MSHYGDKCRTRVIRIIHHQHLELVTKLFRHHFRSTTLKIIEKYTKNYHAVVETYNGFKAVVNFLQRNGLDFVFLMKNSHFCPKSGRFWYQNDRLEISHKFRQSEK